MLLSLGLGPGIMVCYAICVSFCNTYGKDMFSNLSSPEKRLRKQINSAWQGQEMNR